MYLTYDEEQQIKLAREARTMSTSELREALSWQETLLEHSCEIGDASGNSKSYRKMKAIQMELATR